MAPYLGSSTKGVCSCILAHAVDRRIALYRPLGMEVKSPPTVRTPARPYSAPALIRERLPFRVRFVDSAQDLEKAVEIRSSAYSRHVPSVGAALRKPETDDYRRDVRRPLAERKIDGLPVGSVRLQTNVDQPLRIEGELKLPDVYSNRRLIEAMRLGVTNGIPGRLVNAALHQGGIRDMPRMRNRLLDRGRSPVGR